jgi:ferritin-like metal-binding protein YciE
MKLATFDDLYVHELKDLHSAERALQKGLRRMAKAAVSTEVRKALEARAALVAAHLEVLEGLFVDLPSSPRGKRCVTMEGLMDGSAHLEVDAEGAIRDAALIGAVQRAEHYLLAGYGTARTYAGLLGNPTAKQSLQKALNEIGENNKRLKKLATSNVNRKAASKR